MRRRRRSRFRARGTWLIAFVLTIVAADAEAVLFRAADRFPVSGGAAGAAALADLDADGDLDAVVAHPGGFAGSSGRVSLLPGDGEGGFEPPVPLSVGLGGVSSVALGDLDGDRIPDLVVASFLRELSVLLGKGDGSFGSEARFPAAPEFAPRPRSVVIADLDGDHVPDLVTDNGVLLGRGDGSFQDPVPLAGPGVPAVFVSVGDEVKVADLDGDRIPDLVARVSESDGVRVLLGLGDGSFGAPAPFAVGDNPASLAIADVDGDRVPDIVTANSFSDDVSVLRGLGDGSFADAASWTVLDPGSAYSMRPTGVAVLDLDGDRHPDLVTSNRVDDSVSVLLGRGDGGFGAPVAFVAGDDPGFVLAAKLDGDRVPDVLTINSGSTSSAGGVSVLLGSRSGGLEAARSTAVRGSAGGPRVLASADLDGDGRADVVSANEADLSVLLGRGDGSFESIVTFAAGGPPESLVTADLDGDDVPDLAISGRVLLGNGDGSFQAPIAFAGGQVAAVADLDRDGVPDLVTAESTLLGNGDGSFQAPIPFEGEFYPPAVADLDRDGVLDLVRYSFTDDVVGVLLGNGDGSFQAPLEFPAGGDPRAIAAGDLDGDGIPDVVVANSSEAAVSVLLGNGDGTLRPRTAFAVGRLPTHLTLADVDGDGALDVVTANVGSNDLSVSLGRGDGGLRGAFSFFTGDGPGRAVPADLDGDGRSDLVTPNRGNGDLTVLSNVGGAPRLCDVDANGAVDWRDVDTIFEGRGETPLPGDPRNSQGDGWITVGDSRLCALECDFPDCATAGRCGLLGIEPALVLLWASRRRRERRRRGRACTGSTALGLLALVASLPMLPRTAQALELELVPSASTVDLRATFEVDVVVSGLGDEVVGGYDVDLVYDPVTLRATEVHLGPALGRSLGDSRLLQGVVDLAQGSVSSDALLRSSQPGTFVLATVSFLALEPGATTLGLALEAPNGVWGQGGRRLQVQAHGAGVSVAKAPSGLDFEAPILVAADDPRSVAAADLDGDGILDLVYSNLDLGGGGYSVSVALGNGDGTFLPATPFFAGLETGSLAVGDLDLDGVPDLVVVADGRVQRLLGNGDGSFGPPSGLLSGSGSTFVTLADMNEDGFLDVVATGGSSVNVLLGRGNGDFRFRMSFPAPPAPEFPTVADLDADGIADVVVSNPDSDSISVLLGVGDGSLGAAGSWPTGPGPRCVVVEDLDSDGAPDVVTGSRDEDGSVSVLLGNGDGSFQSPALVAAGTAPGCVAVADVDGDGIPDLAAAAGEDVRLLLGNGDGSFRPGAVVPVGQEPFLLTAADVDADAAADLVLSSPPNGVVVLLGNGDGSFPVAGTVVVGEEPFFVAGGDLNADGVADLVATNGSSEQSGAPSGLSVVLGNGDGGFQPFRFLPMSGRPGSVAIADLDGDCRPDLVAPDVENDEVAVWLGDGDGDFQPARLFQAGEVPEHVVVSRLDRDRVPDLAVQGREGVSVLLGTGDGRFAPPTTFPAGDRPNSLQAADLDGDGIRDLVTAASRSEDVNVLLGNGDGSFQPPIPFEAGASPRGVTLADFDADGRLDVVVFEGDASDEIGSVIVLLGNGDGSFQDPMRDVAGERLDFLAVADLENDGLPDLVTSSIATDEVSVARGNGDGTFRSAVSYFAWPEPSSVAVVDVEGDGLPDVVATNRASDTLTVLSNRRDPPRTVEIDVRSGARGRAIASRSHGGVVVVLQGSEELDVARVDVTTLAFGPTGAAPVSLRPLGPKDWNRDGYLDLLSRYRTRETGIRPGDGRACLRGRLLDGSPFRGCEEIRTLPACSAAKPLPWARER